jgi:hypothetical protein
MVFFFRGCGGVIVGRRVVRETHETRQCRYAYRRQRRARHGRSPSEEKLRSVTADAPLARAHAAAAVQLGVCPAAAGCQRGEGHVFAAAHERVGLRHGLDVGGQCEAAVQLGGEGVPAGAFALVRLCSALVADGGMAGDGALCQRAFAAAEAGALARCIDAGDAGGLRGIDRQGLRTGARRREGTAEQLPQLRVGRKAEAAGDALAGDLDFAGAALPKANRLDLRRTLRRDDARRSAVLRIGERHCLRGLARPAREAGAEARDRSE